MIQLRKLKLGYNSTCFRLWSREVVSFFDFAANKFVNYTYRTEHVQNDRNKKKTEALFMGILKIAYKHLIL